MDDKELLELGKLLGLKAIRRVSMERIDMLLHNGTTVALEAMNGSDEYHDWTELVYTVTPAFKAPWLFISDGNGEDK